MAQIAVFVSRHRRGLEECRLWAVSRICPVVAIVDGPLSATSSRCAIVQGRSNGDATFIGFDVASCADFEIEVGHDPG